MCVFLSRTPTNSNSNPIHHQCHHYHYLYNYLYQVPEPHILFFDHRDTLGQLRDRILKVPEKTRLVLQHRVSRSLREERQMSALAAGETEADEGKRLSRWAIDSVGATPYT